MAEASGLELGGWEQAIGLTMVEETAERVVAYVDISPTHHQPYGITHGGVWASIVESVASRGAARAALAMGFPGVVGTSNLTDFLRSLATGRVDVVGEPVFVGRTQQLWTVAISRASDQKLVARGQVRLQNLQTLPAHR
jgi:1,4-dihydroxy-2-naphthoyl-CoA hydrolase